MPINKIVTRQHVPDELFIRAKELRQQMTPAEKLLWSRLHAGRLGGYHFRRQQVIQPYIVDFYCHQVSLVIEVDGGIHAAQEAEDRNREMILKERGLHILRFSNSEVTDNLESVLEIILNYCESII